MKTTFLILATFAFVHNFSAQNCKPINCVIPIKEDCSYYCKQLRILNVANRKELDSLGLFKESINAIIEYRNSLKKGDHIKELKDVIGYKEHDRIFLKQKKDNVSDPKNQ